MSDTVLVAVISGMCVAIPSIITTFKSNSKATALMDYKIDELTKHVEKHNGVVERTYHLEEKMSVIEEKMRVANHRIDDLEK